MIINKHKLEHWYKTFFHKSIYNISEHAISPSPYSNVMHSYDINTINNLTLEYATENLLGEIKKNIASLYSAKEDNILITNGAAEALYILLSLFSEKEKNIIVQSPFYYNYSLLLSNTNTTLRPWNPGKNSNDKVKGLFTLIDANTKAVLLNNPNNPTGLLLSYEEIKEITAACREKEVFVLADEVGLPLTPRIHAIPCYNVSSMFTASIGSLSKLYGAPGLRIGWIVSSSKIIEQCSRYKDVISISNPNVSLFIANKIITNQKLIDKTIDKVFSNISIVNEWMKNNVWYQWEPPTFSLSSLIYYKMRISSFQFCKTILKNYGIFTAPGDCFGIKNSFRISLGCDSLVLSKCLEHLKISSTGPRYEF